MRDLRHTLGCHTIRAEKINKIGRLRHTSWSIILLWHLCSDWTYCEIHIDVFEIQKNSEKDSRSEFVALDAQQSSVRKLLSPRLSGISYLFSHQNRPKKDPEHKPVVLEVNVIDYKEARVE